MHFLCQKNCNWTLELGFHIIFFVKTPLFVAFSGGYTCIFAEKCCVLMLAVSQKGKHSTNNVFFFLQFFLTLGGFFGLLTCFSKCSILQVWCSFSQYVAFFSHRTLLFFLLFKKCMCTCVLHFCWVFHITNHVIYKFMGKRKKPQKSIKNT